MASIMQGTTPVLKIVINPRDFLFSTVTKIELYIQNNDRLEIYGMQDLTIDFEENTMSKFFTEAETSALDKNSELIVQARFWFPDGCIAGINKIVLNVADMLGVGN